MFSTKLLPALGKLSPLPRTHGPLTPLQAFSTGFSIMASILKVPKCSVVAPNFADYRNELLLPASQLQVQCTWLAVYMRDCDATGNAQRG